MSNFSEDERALAEFSPSSWSSNFGVGEAIASYRRSQYIITGQVVASSPPSEHEFETSGESEDIEEQEDLEGDVTPRQADEGILSSLPWDEDLEDVYPESMPQRIQRPQTTQRRFYGSLPSTSVIPSSDDSDASPLLRGFRSRPSITLQLPLIRTGRRNLDNAPGLGLEGMSGEPLPQMDEVSRATLGRKPSASSVRSEKRVAVGRSTFGQTLFNSIAILLGFGMLSEPLAFSYAGWVGGTMLIISYGLITCYSAKILAHIMLEDPSIRTYADIGNKAFGHRSRFLTSALFCLELFAVSVVLVTLYGDSLHLIAPKYSSDAYKLMGLVILIPSVFLPLSLLSYASILGIASTLLVIGVVLFDGTSKVDSPGSLWAPAETRWAIAGLGELGVAFGLFMAGFSGHAVLPSLARDMTDPSQFDLMINCAFLAATVVYMVIGAAGYLMFGNAVSEEVSQDLLATPGYNVFLNHLAVWSLVIMPLTKFALTTRPVNISLEIIFGLEHGPANTGADGHGVVANSNGETRATQKSSHRQYLLKDILTVIERSVFTCLTVAVSILVPDFSSMMAFLGSFSAFMLCVIGPLSAKGALNGRLGWGDTTLLLMGIVMAIWGTIAAFAA